MQHPPRMTPTHHHARPPHSPGVRAAAARCVACTYWHAITTYAGWSGAPFHWPRPGEPYRRASTGPGAAPGRRALRPRRVQ